MNDAGSEGNTLGYRQPFAAEVVPFIIGVGASAGGLEAVQAFLGGIPPGSGVAVVIVFHLDPTSKSVLPDMLARHTLLPVCEPVDGQRVERDHVYTAPANHFVTVLDGRFQVRPFESVADRRTPIDHTLHSLAEHQKGWAAAVILSGAGSDGTLGLKAVSDAGGVTFVQEPTTAKFEGMPQSALSSGAVDHVLPPDAIAAEVVATAVHTRSFALRTSDSELIQQAEHALPAVCDLLLKARGHNFRHYKTSTLVRRLIRRVQVLRLRSVSDYVERLRASEAEAAQLFNDLLINVTAFFRDPEAFAVLTREVLPELFPRGAEDRSVRVWCAGCATGEEAYTLAMLVREYQDTLPGPRPEVQIFATDIDDEALTVARQGVYPVGIADDVEPERLKRFFVKKGQQYHVSKELRDLVLFSLHNVINDPPFSRLDLICCRNLLIYLGSHLQKKLIPLFHYALRPGGYLFLGSSESLSSHRELFRPVDARHRISQRLPTAISPPGLLSGRSGTLPTVRPPNVAPTADPDTYLLMQRIILDEFAPKAVVVNEDGQIVSASGNLEKYLTVSAGAFHNSLTRLVREGLRVGVRSALAEAHKVRRKVTHDGLSVRTDTGVQRVMVTVQPMPQMGEETGLFMVVFQDVGLPLDVESVDRPAGREDASALIEQLERELTSTRDDLERTVQDLEAANEELKSGNEELLSMNEELQSANEELETSKEEVQAANDALLRVNTDLENLLASTQIATLFLDVAGNLRRVTPNAALVYRVREHDIGRPLADFTHLAREMPPLPEYSAVCEAVRPFEHEVEMLSGAVLLRRVMPYRNREEVPEGIVVTFSDITERKRAEQAERRRANELATVLDAVPAVVWTASDPDARDIRGNRTAAQVLRLPSGSNHSLTAPVNDVQIDVAVYHRGRLLSPHDLPVQRAARGEEVAEFEEELVFPDGSRRVLLGNATPLRDDSGRVYGAVAAFLDVTERKRVEEALRAAEDRAEFVRRASGVGFWFCDLPFDELNWDERVKEHFWLPSDARVTIDLFYSRIHPDDREPTRQAIEQSIADHTAYDTHYRTVHPATGEQKWVRAIGRTSYAADGTPVRFDGVTLDVTERVRAEERVRAAEAEFREFANAAPAMLWATDSNGSCTFLSRGWYDFTGQTEAEGLGYGWLDAVHPDDRAEAGRLFAEANALQEGFSLEHRLRRADGEYRWVIDAGRVRRAVDGRFLGYVGSVLDITDRKGAEEARRASEERFRTLFDSMDEGFCVIEFFDGPHGPLSDYVHVLANPAYTANAGIPDIVGQKVREMVPDEAEAWVEIYRSVLLTGQSVRFERELVATGRHLDLAAFRIEPAERKQVAVLFKDVTARKQSEEALREQTQVVETLNAIGTRLAGELDLSRLLQLVTDEVTRLTGAAFGAFFYTASDELGESLKLYTLSGAPREAFSQFPRPRATPLLEPTFRGHGIVRLDDVTADPRFGLSPPHHGMPPGHLQVRSYLAVPVKTRSGEVLGGLFLGHPAVGVFTARHERLVAGVAAQAAVAVDNARLYEQLRDQDRRKDEFLAVLAHELRNPLAPLRSGLAVLGLNNTSGDKSNGLIARMDRQLSQLVHLVDDLLDVSRVSSGKITLKKELLDVRDVVAATLEGFRGVVEGAGHTLDTDLPDYPLPVEGDRTRLIQVLTNLLTNAAKYTPAGGRVKLSAGRESGQVVVRVSDTGMGIPADMLPKVFDLFTQVGHHLERSQGGLGIGLSLVKRLVEMHCGTVVADSPGTGRGSTFLVRLPAAKASVVEPQRSVEPRRSSATRPTHRILVVDDNRDGAESLAMLLNLLGNTVRTAHDGQTGLGIARGFLPQIAFLDIGLPGMNGYEVARAFRADEKLRGVLLVAVTGWGSEEDKQRSREAGFDYHLTKPAQLERVMEVLAAVR